MAHFHLPNLRSMSDDEVKQWVSSLPTEFVFAYLGELTKAITDRFGYNVSIATASERPPKLIELVAHAR